MTKWVVQFIILQGDDQLKYNRSIRHAALAVCMPTLTCWYTFTYSLTQMDTFDANCAPATLHVLLPLVNAFVIAATYIL